MVDCIVFFIYGNCDIKKVILCFFFGGLKKILFDGMKLRGDINVLFFGDLGIVKFQLFKFVEKVVFIFIYIFGKGLLVVGLMVFVQRDQLICEFYFEGGVMVFVDGGVVCIDEFDKMRDED